MIATIKGISFDLWDTIIADDQPNFDRKRNRQHEILRNHGVDETRIDAILNHRFPWESFNCGSATKAISVYDRAHLLLGRDLKNLSRVTIAANELGNVSLEYLPQLIPGVARVLRVLSGAVPLVIITNTRWTPLKVAETILVRLGIGELFSSVVSSDAIGSGKPSARIFEAAWFPWNIDPATTLHVGDSLSRDFAGALSVGARFIHSCVTRVSSQVQLPKNLAPNGVCLVYDDLESLVAYLDSGTLPLGWELVADKLLVAPPSATLGRINVNTTANCWVIGPALSAERRSPSSHVCILPDSSKTWPKLCTGDLVLIDADRELVWRKCQDV